VSGSSLPESLLLLPELCNPDPELLSDQHDPNGVIVGKMSDRIATLTVS
jgi:hypothetical protein